MMTIKSCIRCTHFIRCKDPLKSIAFKCDRFAISKESLETESKFLSNALEMPFVASASGLALPSGYQPGDPNEIVNFDASAVLNDMLSSKSMVSPDLKIPEEDFPEAPNFYTWCVSDQFLDQKPFVMQALIGTKLFGEYCPTCSDMEWMENGVKVNDPLGKFASKIALLEYGKCRYCKKTKLDFYRKGTLNPYVELALSAGQRCVVAETLVLTSDGLVEIGDYSENRPYGFSEFGVRFQTDSTLDQASQFYRARAERCHTVSTKHGSFVTGTTEHPIMTLDGFVRLEDVVLDDYVRVYFGQNVFGNKTTLLKDVTDKTDVQFEAYISALPTRNRPNVLRPRRRPGNGRFNKYFVDEDVARMLGYWVAEGRNRGIANDDQNVLDDCYRTLISMFSENLIRRGTGGIEFSNTYVRMWLGNLLQFDVNSKSAGKEIPRCILQASKSVQAAFLSALFEGDGGVVRKRIRGNIVYSVGYASISRRLIDQLSAVLLNFGIVHKRRTRKSLATNGSVNQVEKDVFCLGITGKYVETFAQTIGFQSERKQRLLRKAVSAIKNKTNNVPFYFDKLPPNLCSKFYTALALVRDELSQLAKSGSPHSIGLQSIYGKGHRAFTRIDRQRTLTKFDVDSFILPLLSTDFCFSGEVYGLLRELSDYSTTCNYYYDPVVANILSNEKFETFDVTVPGKHRFISNGLLSHNSGKSAAFGMMASYLTHRMIKLIRPNEVFGLLKANVLQGTFVALTAKQAMDTLYEPFYGHLIDAPWFQNYNKMLREVESHSGGEGTLFKLKDTFVAYKHRRLMCLTDSNLIDTKRGLLPISNVVVGDYVKGLNGRYSKVSHWFDNGEKKCFSISVEHGTEIEGSADHPVLVLDTDSLVPVWKKLGDLRIGDLLALNTSESSFGKSTHDYSTLKDTQVYVSVFQKIAELKTFTSATLAASLDFEYTFLPALLSRMLKSGLIKARKNIRTCRTDPIYTYTSTKNFSVAKAISWKRTPQKSGKSHSRFRVTIPSTITQEVGAILGYLVAEGSCVRSIRFGNSDPEVLEDFARLMYEAFNVSYMAEGFEKKWAKAVKRFESGCVRPAKRNSFKSSKPSSGFRVLAKDIKAFLRHVGLTKAYAASKEVPSSMFSASKATVRAFLQALFECDGCLSRDAYAQVSYTSRSQKLVAGVQQLCFMFGVTSTITSKTIESEPMYGLRFGPVNSALFISRIGFRFKHLTRLRSADFAKNKDKNYVLPLRYDYYRGAKVSLLDTLDSSSFLRHLAVDDSQAFNALESLKSMDLIWTPVTAIKSVGRKKVYDITVNDQQHLFTANGLIVHNCYPAGPDKRILRGRTRFLAGIDELGWFSNSAEANKQIKMGANEVYIALERSLLTVRAKAKAVVKTGFYNVPFGYFINISSPSSVRDKIMELVRKAHGSKHILGMCLPTWKMNPHVPRSALAEEFRKDYDTAMRDYGAQPPLTNSPFISAAEKIEVCFSKKTHYFKQIYHFVKSKDKSSSEVYTELDDLVRIGKASVLALDAGFSNNSFAFALGHLAKNGYPVISLVGEVMPQSGIRINHSLVYSELLSDIIEMRNVVLLTADRWNSLKVLSDAEQDFDIQKRQYSLKYVDMQLFKSYIDDKQVLLPRPSKPISEIVKYDHVTYPQCFKRLPADHLALQLLTVQDTGTSILKGDQLTDDILRATMLCFRMLVDEDNLELLSQADSEVAGFDLSKMAVSKLYSGGGTGASGMGGGQQSNSLGLLKQRQ